MREDLTDLREDVTDLRTTVDNGFIEMRGKLDATAAGQQQIVGLLNTLITQQGGQPSDRQPVSERLGGRGCGAPVR